MLHNAVRAKDQEITANLSVVPGQGRRGLLDLRRLRMYVGAEPAPYKHPWIGWVVNPEYKRKGV